MMRSGAAPRRASAGSSFHFSFGLLPRRKREAIETVYAFCRIVDDVADDLERDRDSAAAELRGYRDEIELCYTGRPTRSITRRLQGCIREFGIPRAPFDAVLEGVEMDLHKTRYADFQELRGYCYRVASAVGLVCIAIFECRHPASRDYAVELGIALQLTNILRDLKADARRGRIYLPQDELAAFGLHESDLLAGVCNDAYVALMRHQAARAHRHFEQAAALLPAADKKRLVAAQVMAAIYRRLLRRIEADRFRVFERRIVVSRWMQASLALRARVASLVGE